MKIYYFLLFVLIASCQKGQSPELNKEKNLEVNVSGNAKTELRFRNAKQNETVKDDSLTTHFKFDKLKELQCKTKFLSENDFENEESFIREYEIKISDTLLINVLREQRKGNVYDYVYFYKGKNFNVINYYGKMFSRKSELYFDFESRQAYKISNDKLLLREQPSTWCGLANQMDFFQIVDLKNMEISQFVDYDTIVK
ncbi:hypothetical protein L1S35_05310 [Flavobacterium sp. AS60]|uniref:hypothetical protein n=1 Tax=Flavobacterium anseongense TaxID=2910677 RepID=UPI001F382AFD|nr:hypothetical protein [Flavobacterium sp. AS60]MCF6129083.1 hypothetical protein [Flavobacterium sp. AS60]